MKRFVATPFALAALFVLALSPAFARGTYDPGASDTGIKIGTTWAFSGPGSVTAPLERQMAAYLRMVNEQGGVNGRKIDLIALDDGYIPAKTVEDVRRLIELDHVLFMYGQLGTPTNIAVRPYLNAHRIPQIFVTTGSNSLVNPKKYPWTMGFAASYALESRVFAKYLLAEHPNAKVGVLYQQDDFGSDHLDPFLAALGDKAKTMVVARESYGATDPNVTSQIISIHAAGADTLYVMAQSRPAVQAVSAARDQPGWNALIFMSYVATAKSVAGSLGSKLTGVMSIDSTKDPTDPGFADDPAVKDYLAWVKKYAPAQDQASDAAAPAGYLSAQVLIDVLKRCGDTLTRANVMKQATSIHDLSLPLLLPGIVLNTSPTRYFALHAAVLKQYNGTRWVIVGKPIAE
ncbi:MAG TPA: ABC transporter substrate-binding protein [Stellaceae bacterium]|nr:ABC transporter substrate-binding protein [Stellaceae bacterium]